jgi:hypothetical protein
MTTTNKPPAEIVAYWDTAEPDNHGWAYRLYWCDEDGNIEHEESGAIDSDLESDATPADVRAALPCARTLEQHRYGMTREADGSIVWRQA